MSKLFNLLNLGVVSFSLFAGAVIAQEVVQMFPEGEVTQSEPEPAPEIVNPNPNPLFFPTDVEDVEIEGVIPISLEQALEIGLRNNKELQIARLELERSQSQLREATAALYPNLDFDFNFAYENSAATKISNDRLRFGLAPDNSPIERDPTFVEQSIVDPNTVNVNGLLELTYDIYTGGSRGATIRREKRSVRSQQLNLETIQEETRFNITRDYYDLQNADAQVAIAQAAVEDATQSLRDAQLREQAGLGTRFEVLQAEVDVANASQGLTRAISDQRTARRQLADTLSIGQRVELSAADEISEAGEWELSLNESIVLAYKNRAELESSLLDREIGEENREIALSGIRPTVSIFANYNFLDNDLKDPIDVAGGYAFGGRLRWRLFDGGRAFANAEQANRDVEIAETQFAQQRNQIRLQVETAYYELIANRDNIDTARTAVISAEESLRLARLRFQAGVGTQTDVINAQRDLTDARGNFLQAVIGYNQSLNSLQRAVSNLPDNLLFQQR